MLSEEEFKTRFRYKITYLVNDWFNKEAKELIVQDNYETYLKILPEISPEELALQYFNSLGREFNVKQTRI